MSTTLTPEDAEAIAELPGVEVDDIGTTAKTMPEFTALWQRMLDPSSDAAGLTSEPVGAS